MPYRHDMLIHRSRALKLGTSQPRYKAQKHCQGARLRLVVAGPSFSPASMHPAGPEGLRTVPHQPSSTLLIGALESAASFPKQHLPRGYTSHPTSLRFHHINPPLFVASPVPQQHALSAPDRTGPPQRQNTQHNRGYQNRYPGFAHEDPSPVTRCLVIPPGRVA